MGVFRRAVGTMVRRPFIIFYLGVIMLVWSGLNHYNPLFTLLFGLSTMGGGNVLDSLISFLQFSTNLFVGPGALWMVSGLLAAIVLVSLAAGLVFSGYFNIVNNALDRKPKHKGEFSFGIRNFFPRLTFISIRVLFFGALFIVFMLIASVPGMVMTRLAISSRPELYVLAVLFDILTVLVLFFCSLFFRIYLLFWYPAALNTESNSFTRGKRVADRHFWSIAGRLVLFDLVFILFQSVATYLNHFSGTKEAANRTFALAMFLGNWIFKTIFFAALITYIFSAFKTYSAEGAGREAPDSRHEVRG